MRAGVVTVHNPYHPLRHREVCTVDRPHTLRDLAPRLDRPFICVHNGQALLRKDWDTRVRDGDVVVFSVLPRGNVGRLLASLAVMVFAWWAAPFVATALFGAELAASAIFGTITVTQLVQSAISLVGSMLVSALMPAPSMQSLTNAAKAPSPTYSLEAQGNTARLGNPIPVQYGRVRAFPDYAALPYVEHHSNDQYLYQLFCIGQGQFDVEAIQIEDTAIDNFEDVDYQLVNPGESLTLFPSNVITSVEVSGQDLNVQYEVKGPYTANPAGTDAIYLSVDIVCPRGLYDLDNDTGKMAPQSITVLIEAREIDDAGDPVGSWFTLGSVSRTASTTTPQRWTYKYAVTSGRYEVRAQRTSAPETSDRTIAEDVVWAGLRAYLPETRNYGDVTLLAVAMKATDQLSGQAARKINVIGTRKLPTWTPGGGWSASATATSSIADALMDAATATYGADLDDARVDLTGLVQLRDVWTARGDEFNFRFDSTATVWDALTTIARAGRCKPYMQQGVLRFFRDAAVDTPIALYSMRNILKGSFGIEYIMPVEQPADCVKVSYWDENYWTERTVLAVLTGETDDNPAEIALPGVTSRDQAYREGLYYAACNKYRRKTIKFATEMEGFLPALGDLIAIQHDLPAWGQHAEVTAVSANRALRSQELDNAAWTKTTLTTAGMANVAAAPDGTTTAEQLVASGANGTCLQAVTAASAAYVFSIYLKRKTGTGNVQITVNGGTAWTTVAVDAAWQRFEVTATTANPSGGVRIVTSGDAVYAWGGQIEAGSVAGPYAPTTSAAVTILSLTEPLTWEPGATHYVGLRSAIGGVLGPYTAIQCPMHAEAVATADALDETPYTGGGAERTHIAFGYGETWRQEARVLAIRPRSLTQVEIECINEDPSVHTAETGMTAPAVQSSQLPTMYTAPVVSGLSAYSDPTDASIMLLEWQPAAGADHYLVEVSHADDQQTWQRVGDTTANNYQVLALYGNATVIRVAGVGMTRGPWAMVGYSSFSDYMWNPTDSTLMWNAVDTTLMWA
jgi:hypothetical protein